MRRGGGSMKFCNVRFALCLLCIAIPESIRWHHRRTHRRRKTCRVSFPRSPLTRRRRIGTFQSACIGATRICIPHFRWTPGLSAAVWVRQTRTDLRKAGSNGFQGQRGPSRAPARFLVVADHSDGFGFFPLLFSGDPAIMADPQGRRWNEMILSGQGAAAAIEMITSFGRGTISRAIFPVPGTTAYQRCVGRGHQGR